MENSRRRQLVRNSYKFAGRAAAPSAAGLTAAEIIRRRADAGKTNMGLTAWSGSRVLRSRSYPPTVVLTADGADITAGACITLSSASLNVVGIEQGTHTITASVADLAGNVAIATSEDPVPVQRDPLRPWPRRVLPDHPPRPRAPVRS